MINLSVVIYTVRAGGLNWMLRLLGNQTFPTTNFELIVVDGFFEERKDSLGKLAKSLGIHLIHLPEPILSYRPMDYVIASNGNLALAHVTTDHVIIIDDWHFFPQNLLETHMKYLALGYAAIPQWHHVEFTEPTGLEYQTGYDDFVATNIRITERDSRASGLQNLPPGKILVDVPSSWWWPNSTSVPAKYMIDLAQGYDERLNGGTGGTDNDIAWRMGEFGLKCIYIPDLVVYHIDTRSLPRRPYPGVCDGPHDRAPFVCNQYHHGDPNLVENEYLRAYVEDDVKFFVCKRCGVCGVLDSQDVLRSNIKNHRLVPPNFAAGHSRSDLLRVREEMRKNGYCHSSRCVLCTPDIRIDT